MKKNDFPNLEGGECYKISTAPDDLNKLLGPEIDVTMYILGF
jgi:hypothetical protein